MKYCKACNKVKPLDDFYKTWSICKECAKESRMESYYNKQGISYKQAKERKAAKFKRLKREHATKVLLKYSRRHVKKCYSCGEYKNKSEYHKDSSSFTGLQSKCKSCNVVTYSELTQEQKNAVIKRVSEWRKNKLSEDPVFKLKCNVRDYTRNYLNRRGITKNGSLSKAIGCSSEHLKEHMEKQFLKGMNWDNYGEWHIDHITPLSTAKTEEEVLKLTHYTNLQPLWAEDNILKGDKNYPVCVLL